jgi:hypothetical protein
VGFGVEFREESIILFSWSSSARVADKLLFIFLFVVLSIFFA